MTTTPHTKCAMPEVCPEHAHAHFATPHTAEALAHILFSDECTVGNIEHAAAMLRSQAQEIEVLKQEGKSLRLEIMNYSAFSERRAGEQAAEIKRLRTALLKVTLRFEQDGVYELGIAHAALNPTGEKG